MKKWNLIGTSLGLGVIYWIADILVDVFIFNEGSLAQQIISPTLQELWTRLFALVTITVFGIYTLNTINKQRQIAQNLKKSNELYRLLFQCSPSGVFYYGTNLKITDCNNRFIDILQSDYERLVGFDMNTLKDQSVIPSIRKAIEGKEGFYEGFYRASTSKAEIWITMRTSPIFGSDGQSTGGMGMVEDITERKKAEIALHESEGKFKSLSQEFNALLNTIPDVLTLISPDMKVLWANDSAAISLGKSTSELTGQLCYHLWHKSNAPCNDCLAKKSFLTGEIENTTITSSADGRLLDLRAVPIKDAKGKVISVIEVARDITEHRKLEIQLQQAQKMEAIGTLTGGIAHDFNNILTAIIGYGNILKMKLEKESQLMTYTDQILASAERAANLTQSLLAFSRKQIINPNPVNLNEIVAAVEKILHRVIGENIELRIILSGKIRDLRVMADIGQIEQVLMNLAVNAKDAMPEGGTLTIETELKELDMDFLKTHAYGKSGMYAVITVTDTGHGMDETTRQKIFEPFFTTKEVGKGTGLGLSIVYGIIKQHNGYINCYSEQGRGTTFRVYLPSIESEAENIKKEEHITLSAGAETILLAEDEKEVRNLMRLVLEEAGYKVIEAANGEEAIEKFMKNIDSIDLLLLDVIMPKANGKWVYEEAKKIKPAVKALFSSGYPADLIHKQGILEEGLNFISKPASPHALLKKIREVLDK